MGVDHLGPKLEGLALEGRTEIAMTLTSAQAEGVKVGAPGYVSDQELMVAGFRKILERMAPIVIDVNAHDDEAAIVVFEQAAIKLADVLLGAKSTAMLGSDSVDRRAELAGLAQVAARDARRRAIGETVVESRVPINMSGTNIATATHGGMVRDGDQSQEGPLPSGG